MTAGFTASMNLEHMLKAYRMRQAGLRDLPCYSVLGDLLIKHIIEQRPKDRQVRSLLLACHCHVQPTVLRAQELSRIKGMTQQRCEWYGTDILRLVQQARGGSVTLRHDKGSGHRLTKPQLPAGRRVRKAHDWSDPYARAPAKRVFNGLVTPSEGRDDDVYVLELAAGRVYVGKSGNVIKRVGQVCARVIMPNRLVLTRIIRSTNPERAAHSPRRSLRRGIGSRGSATCAGAGTPPSGTRRCATCSCAASTTCGAGATRRSSCRTRWSRTPSATYASSSTSAGAVAGGITSWAHVASSSTGWAGAFARTADPPALESRYSASSARASRL